MATERYWPDKYWAGSPSDTSFRYWPVAYWGQQSSEVGDYWYPKYWTTGYWPVGYWRSGETTPTASVGVFSSTLEDWTGTLTGLVSGVTVSNGVFSTTLANWTGLLTGGAIQVEYFDAGGTYWRTGYWATGFWGTNYWVSTRDTFIDLGVAWSITTYPGNEGDLTTTLDDWTGLITAESGYPDLAVGTFATTLESWTGELTGEVTAPEPFTGAFDTTLEDWSGLILGTSSEPVEPGAPISGVFSTTLADWTGHLFGTLNPEGGNVGDIELSSAAFVDIEMTSESIEVELM